MNFQPENPLNKITEKIIGAAIEIHRTLGPGLLESAYEACICYELANSGLNFQRQVNLPVKYKGIDLDCNYRMDLVVEDQVLVELKSVESILPIHEAQLITYLKLANLPLGLLINFNVETLRMGIRRRKNGYIQGEITDRTVK